MPPPFKELQFIAFFFICWYTDQLRKAVSQMKKFFLGFVTALALLGVLSAENVVYLSFDPLTETASAANASYNSGYSAGYNAGYDSGYDFGYDKACSRADTTRQAYAPPSDLKLFISFPLRMKLLMFPATAQSVRLKTATLPPLRQTSCMSPAPGKSITVTAVNTSKTAALRNLSPTRSLRVIPPVPNAAAKCQCREFRRLLFSSALN